MKYEPSTPRVRLAELMASLSLATDLTMGQPLEYALSCCVLGMRLGASLGLNDSELRDVYYQSLLRYVGCNAETHVLAALFGDELVIRNKTASIDMSKPAEALSLITQTIRTVYPEAGILQLAQMVARGALARPVVEQSFAGHCEVAQRLGERLGFPQSLVQALGQLYERWDGKGTPGGLKAEAIARSTRIVNLVHDAVTFHRMGGAEAAVAVIANRKGSAYDPQIAEHFCQHAGQLFRGFLAQPSWPEVLALEPAPQMVLSDQEFDQACQSLAYFVDIKTPYTLSHSSRVAALATEASRRFGLSQNDTIILWRAACVHDLGRVGVSTGIWVKPGPLSEADWTKVRLHPYFTECVLAQSAVLAPLGNLAAQHHERLDGSGYHRGSGAAGLSVLARLLAACDAYQAMTEARPHRPAISPDEAAETLRREVRSGKLDADAVSAVLEAAGHARPHRPERIAGLSERELEVLRLLAKGQSTKQVAKTLSISPKTADHHIQHLYSKIGVSTRAGATLFAMEHGLIG